MSRFREGDGFESDAEQEEFDQRISAAYQLAKTDLQGFLRHLDAMPVKRIIANRFIAPASGDACAVAEFCRFKGTPPSELLKAEAESRLERLEYDGHEADNGWDGPTIGMGIKAGLPEYLAYNLAFKNDMNWDRVTIGREPCTCAVSRQESVFHGTGCRSGYAIYRAMTAEERWLRLRNHVAKSIGEPILKVR